MYLFWHSFYVVCEWLLVLAGIGFVAAIAFIAKSALDLKNSAMLHIKRLYQPPMNSVKSLAATGKSVAQRELVHVKKIGGHVSDMAASVKETGSEVGQAAKSVKAADTQEIKTSLAEIKGTFSLLSTILHFGQNVAKHRRVKTNF